jgi:hypothetical protein
MKTQWITSLALSFAAIFIFSARLHSQGPGAEKSPLQTAYGLKAKNQEIIEKQTQTLLKLDDLDKAAAQLKAFGKRT